MTSEAKHSPGPWTVGEWAEGAPEHFRSFVLVESPTGGDAYDKGGDVAYVCPCDDGEQEANARLVAAAPTLADALKELHDVGRDIEDADRITLTLQDRLIAALTKSLAALSLLDRKDSHAV